ncbi:MAG: hypothetical protein J5552_06750 [Prevotella sp.]|nr:hypothetical protein [Prevotella sp.]
MKRPRFSIIAASIAIVLVIIAVSFMFAPPLQNEILDYVRYLLIAITGIVAGWKMTHPSKKEEGAEKDERKSPKPFVGIVIMVVGVMLLAGLHLLHVPLVNPLLLFALALIVLGLILHVRAIKRESNY